MGRKSNLDLDREEYHQLQTEARREIYAQIETLCVCAAPGWSGDRAAYALDILGSARKGLDETQFDYQEDHNFLHMAGDLFKHLTGSADPPSWLGRKVPFEPRRPPCPSLKPWLPSE